MFPQIPITSYIGIQTFWLFGLLGFLAWLKLFFRGAQRRRLNLSFIFKRSGRFILVGILGARIGRALTIWPEYVNGSRAWLDILFFVNKEYSVWGGIVAMTLLLLWFCRKDIAEFWQWIENSINPFLIAFAIGNIGVFLDGRRFFGTPTTLPWGVTIETSKYAVPIHPNPLYTTLYCILIVAFTKWLYKQPKWREYFELPQRKVALSIGLFSTCRFAQEFITGSDKFLLIFDIYISYFIFGTVAGIAWAYLFQAQLKTFYKTIKSWVS